MKLKFFKTIAIFLVAALGSCIYKYEADIESLGLPTSLVTIEGDIIVGDTTIINIGYSHKAVTKSSSVHYDTYWQEKSASVWIEDENGNTWWGKDTLINVHYVKDDYYNGISKYKPALQWRYFIDTRDLDINGKYRLCVSIPERGEYVTPFKNVLIAQDIDSLSYIVEPDRTNVHIMVSSSGKDGQSQYYRWHYREDWENDPPVMPQVIYDLRENDLYSLGREYKDSLSRCMSFSNSYEILLENTGHLEQNRLVNYRIISFPTKSRRMVGLYCFTLYQTPLDKDGYDFYKAMAVNDDLGGLYAPYPNDIIGNISSTTNSSETVLGYINVCTRSKKRVFVDGYKLKFIDRNECTRERKVIGKSDWMREYYKDMRPYDYYRDNDSTHWKKAYWGSFFCYGIEVCAPRPYYWPKQ
ncbi:MAG: DUF4249 family protein [Bacteroidales bacterium]|nr:DUF4249 family protein [Bacteroidales bacterium]